MQHAKKNDTPSIQTKECDQDILDIMRLELLNSYKYNEHIFSMCHRQLNKILIVKSGKNCENRGENCENRENRILSPPKNDPGYVPEWSIDRFNIGR